MKFLLKKKKHFCEWEEQNTDDVCDKNQVRLQNLVSLYKYVQL